MASSSNSSPDPTFSHWNPWVICSVAIICTFTILFSYYKLLRRLFHRLHSTNFSRNPTRRRILQNEVNPDDPSLQFHSRGLDFPIVESLPKAQFKKKDELEAAEQGQSNTDCAVCLGEFEEGEWLKRLPKCAHEFHITCIDTWFVSHSNCPLCRSQVYDFAHDCQVPIESEPETLRYDLIQERGLHYQMLRSAILQSSPL